MILELRAAQKLQNLKCLILFDEPGDLEINLASQVGLEVYCFKDLIIQGGLTPDQ